MVGVLWLWLWLWLCGCVVVWLCGCVVVLLCCCVVGSSPPPADFFREGTPDIQIRKIN